MSSATYISFEQLCDRDVGRTALLEKLTELLPSNKLDIGRPFVAGQGGAQGWAAGGGIGAAFPHPEQTLDQIAGVIRESLEESDMTNKVIVALIYNAAVEEDATLLTVNYVTVPVTVAV